MKTFKFIALLFLIVSSGCGGVPSLSEKEVERLQKAYRAAICNVHCEWSNEHKDLIKESKICTGMSKEQVELAWDKTLYLEYESSSGSEYYSEYGQNPRRGGGYSFWFDNDKLRSWSWTPVNYYNPNIGYY